MTVLHHAAICTADVDRSLSFWRDGLGMAPVMDLEFPGRWTELFGAATDRLRSVFLADPAHPEAGIVELVAFDDPDPLPPVPGRPQLGFFLLSFMVEVEEVLARLAGLGFTEGVRRIEQPAPGDLVVPMAVVRAPDGVLVELIGTARPRTAA